MFPLESDVASPITVTFAVKISSGYAVNAIFAADPREISVMSSSSTVTVMVTSSISYKVTREVPVLILSPASSSTLVITPLYLAHTALPSI